MNKRIKWIDYAKGIAIILMIIAHSLEMNSFARNFIFSFHMPLFFILSGYNIKNVNNKEELFSSIFKDFRSLLIPCFIVISICCVVKYWDYGLVYIIKNIFFSVIWGNGVNNETFNQLFGVSVVYGAFWFLICLFLGKSIFRLIEFCANKQIKLWLYLFLVFIGLMIGFNYWLSFSFDIVLVSLLFLKLGQLYRIYEVFLSKFYKYICIIFILIWCICLVNGIYIELAVRHYPLFIISIIESICGSFVVIYFCKYLERFNLKFLSYIGRCSLIILIVHSIEGILFDYSYLSEVIGNGLFIFFKVLIILLISFMINIFSKRVRMLK